MITRHSNGEGIFTVPACCGVIAGFCVFLFFMVVQLTDASGESPPAGEFRKQAAGRYEFTIPVTFKAVASEFKIHDVGVREVPVTDAGTNPDRVWKKEIHKINAETLGANYEKVIIVEQGQLAKGVPFIIYRAPLSESLIYSRAMLTTSSAYVFLDIEAVTQEASREDLKRRTMALVSAYRHHTGSSIPGKDFFYTGYGYIALPDTDNRDGFANVTFSAGNENFLTVYMTKSLPEKPGKSRLFSHVLKKAVKMWPGAESELKDMKVIREHRRTVCGLKGEETVAYDKGASRKNSPGNSLFRFRNPEDHKKLSVDMTVNSASQADFDIWLKTWDTILDSVRKVSSK